MLKKMILILLVLLNIYTFVTVRMDKQSAVNGSSRVPEVRLVAISSLGGAPGMLLGFNVFNHKTNVVRKGYLQDAIKLVLFQNLIMYGFVFFSLRKKKEKVWRY
ncbi:DUF1294 domain-containing protein [Oceanispirochaeta crateris]|uniref:DUF1294 domain-containing protein n=1 Tax=Oceanispirochaeta crateris TaxID=2518645 RepID=A0A5C1QID7_9SPIO|nr:DUF1294 domain-containing protein [Oceanispirochaeta crateris]QEN07341.1 DUF1294 domain-containing protein [Oceanispirochaeta crateris]